MKRRKFKIKYPDNKGNTMFETIIAFFILTIILALIYQMISFCAQLRMKAADTGFVISEFNRDMYKTGIKTDGTFTAAQTFGSVDATPRSSEAGNKGPLFYLVLSDETDDSNLKTDHVADFTLDTTANNMESPYRIRLTNLHANSLVSNDLRIEEEKLVKPKALQFYYLK